MELLLKKEQFKREERMAEFDLENWDIGRLFDLTSSTTFDLRSIYGIIVRKDYYI